MKPPRVSGRAHAGPPALLLHLWASAQGVRVRVLSARENELLDESWKPYA